MYAILRATLAEYRIGGQVSMADTPGQEIKLFYCYSREDKELRDELEIHLSALKRQYRLTSWHDREILPGEEWEKAIDAHLSAAHIIFLLLSPHFMASPACYREDLGLALHTGCCSCQHHQGGHLR